jgi:apolipoprotein N-acyltransferase
MVVVRAARVTQAFLWGWIGGCIFFLLNLWYLSVVTVPGWIALSLYCALYWGLAAGLIRGLGLLDCAQANRGGRLLLGVLSVGAVWTTTEWLRGTVMTGLPFIYIGHTQTPFLAMCQVADFGGALAVSFWLAMVNAVMLVVLQHWRNRIVLTPVITGSLAVLLLFFAYGVLRMEQVATAPGPRIMVVQPNHLHVRGGGRPVTQEQQVDFHFTTTLAALEQSAAPDLIVWSETVMPPLNDEVRHETRNTASGPFLQSVHDRISDLARAQQSGLLTGGYYVGGFQEVGGTRRATDVRNAVFFYDRDGQQVARYDKVHLVPFGEFIPFRLSLPALFQLFLWLSPHQEEYTISAGPDDALTVIELHRRPPETLRPWRLVTPICFEDLDAPLVARMFRPLGQNRRKRADILVNVTNDGWFRFNAMSQHLQAAVFRSIENRVPTARSVNNGISGFIDSCGRIDWDATIPASQQGTRIAEVQIDERLSFYTTQGDVFSWTCALVVLFLAAGRLKRSAPASSEPVE